MDLRSTPYRSEVARWSPNELADYFRRLNFKDCEKVVRKLNITGQRFLNMSENDIQKFPKLKVPIFLENPHLGAKRNIHAKFQAYRLYSSGYIYSLMMADEILPKCCYNFKSTTIMTWENTQTKLNTIHGLPPILKFSMISCPSINHCSYLLLKTNILSKLSQEINRHEEKRSIFTKRTQKSPEHTEYKPQEGDGWSSFDESDDYESPDEDQTGDGVDYETPNDQDGFEDENDADYEPPPSNDEDILRNAIFPHKPIPAISDYIDRPATERGKTSLQPPVPPQRPAHSPIPGGSRSRVHGTPFSSPSSNNDSYRDKSANLFKPPVDRSKKPPMDRPGTTFERESLGAGKRAFPEMALTPKLRSLAEDLAKIQKPPLPPTDRFEKNSPSSRRMPLLTKSNQMLERQTEMESDNILQRPVPLPSSQPFNTFPSRTTKSNIIPLPAKMKPDLHRESFPSSASLPPRLLPSNLSRNFSKTPADGRPPLPIPNKPNAEFPKADNERMEHSHKGLQNQKWYVADITRSDAEVALRNINQDGSFLVRDSSKKTVEQPYVLMVLYHNKVYNIQIRYQPETQVYFLGTSLKGNEDFTSVTDIVDYFKRMPLLLIDGKDRCSKKQCVLTYDAGTF